MHKYSAIVIAALLGGCTLQPSERFGNFTTASTFNVRNLNYDQKTSVQTKGEDCHELGDSANDQRIQRAVDDAIRNGQRSKPDYDLLTNVRIDHTQVFRVTKKPILSDLGIPAKFDCIVVTGDLVQVSGK